MPPVEKILPYKPKPVPFKEGLVARESKQNNFIATPLDFFKILYRQNSDEQIAVKMNQTLTAPVTAALVRRHRLGVGIESRTGSEAAELNWKNNPVYRQERIIFLRSEGLKQKVKAAQDRIRQEKQERILGGNPEEKLRQMFFGERKNVREIATILKVSKTVLYPWLRRIGVKFRSGRDLTKWMNNRDIVISANKNALLGQLSQIEREILEKRYLDRKELPSLRMLGEDYGIRFQTVSFHEQQALRKLTDWLRQE